MPGFSFLSAKAAIVVDCNSLFLEHPLIFVTNSVEIKVQASKEKSMEVLPVGLINCTRGGLQRVHLVVLTARLEDLPEILVRILRTALLKMVLQNVLERVVGSQNVLPLLVDIVLLLRMIHRIGLTDMAEETSMTGGMRGSLKILLKQMRIILSLC